MSGDEARARDLVAQGHPAEALVYALLDVKSVLESLRQTTAFANVHRNTWMRTIAQQEGRAVTLIRRTGTDPEIWRGEWHAGSTGGSKSHEGVGKENVLRWAANLPAGVRLILDPDTNEWIPWEDMEAEAYVNRDVED